jgi:hypothetical protein
MSTKLRYSLTFGSLFFLGFGSSWMISNFDLDTDHSDRIIASVKENSTINMEKHLMPLVITVSGPEVFPQDPDAIVKLKGTVRTPFKDFTSINYKWILPDEVEVVKGYVSSDILNPVANQSYEVEISVKGFNSLDRKDVSLIATTRDPNGEQLGNSAVITSRPEDSMEHIAPAMMVKAQEFKASQALERMPASEDAQ